jgi:pilus assembly protein CpaB
MKQRLAIVLLFALVVALAASFGVYRLVEGRLTAMAASTAGKVLVASSDLPVGTLLKESDLKLSNWPGPIPTGAVTKVVDATGRGVVANIYSGEPILDSRLAPRGAGAGLAATIPSGMRAVAVRVNDFVGVAGFVVAGMRVDVLVSGLPPNTGNRDRLGTQTRTVLQNIEVLSAGQTIQKDAEGKPLQVPVVNLLVTPEQAETLSLASNETKIQLVLRNPLDTKEAKAPGTAVAYLFEGVPSAKPKPTWQKPKVAPPVEKQRTQAVVTPIMMEVIQGAKRDNVKVGQTVTEKPVATETTAETKRESVKPTPTVQ